VGQLFASFDDAWSSFLEREEPLESFHAGLPDRDATLPIWYIEPAGPVKDAAALIQESFAHLEAIAPPPRHFLHVTVSSLDFDLSPEQIESEIDKAAAAWRNIAPFRIVYPRLNCFHEAVIAEVVGDGPRTVLQHLYPDEDLSLFLPHCSLGYAREPIPPDDLRQALLPARETNLGAHEVRAIKLCLVPASRTTILSPWTVAASVPLAG
jgi:hypothetical protein